MPQAKKTERGRTNKNINCYENVLVDSEGKGKVEQMTRRQMNGKLWLSFNRQRYHWPTYMLVKMWSVQRVLEFQGL